MEYLFQPKKPFKRIIPPIYRHNLLILGQIRISVLRQKQFVALGCRGRETQKSEVQASQIAH
jgi:hypothetical protein